MGMKAYGKARDRGDQGICKQRISGFDKECSSEEAYSAVDLALKIPWMHLDPGRSLGRVPGTQLLILAI